MGAIAETGWDNATELFSRLELQVIVLAVAAGSECGGTQGCGQTTRSRIGGWFDKLFAIHRPAPLANPKLETLRQLACNAFAGRGKIDPVLAACAREQGFSALQLEWLGRMLATGQLPAQR
jgi:hypothetical protein